MSSHDPIFTSSIASLDNQGLGATLGATFTSNSAPLGSGEWAEIEEDPEMRCDDDFLSFLNNHTHPTSGFGPSAPAINCVMTDTPLIGHVAPATGTVIKQAYGPLSVTEDYYLPTRTEVGTTNIEEEEEMLCGWECPRCKLCLSPHVDSCERCAPAWG